MEKIANGEPQSGAWPLLDAAAAILDAHIVAKQALLPDPHATDAIH